MTPKLGSAPVLLSSFIEVSTQMHRLYDFDTSSAGGDAVLSAPFVSMSNTPVYSTQKLANSQIGQAPYRRLVFDYRVTLRGQASPSWEYQVHYLETYNSIEVHINKLNDHNQLGAYNPIWLSGQQLTTDLRLIQDKKHSLFLTGRATDDDHSLTLDLGLAKDSVRFMTMPPQLPSSEAPGELVSEDMSGLHVNLEWQAATDETSIDGYRVIAVDSNGFEVQMLSNLVKTGAANYNVSILKSSIVSEAVAIEVATYNPGGLSRERIHRMLN
ncbi:hypothetical protein F0223_20050 [Vibrio coralliilyticus]|uniref:hypothetical protein n=2 Tax=Vibrio TaxID=662 RepID=UPI00148C5F1D|nr:hypothetical protein [Vibrio coralliilyticus]NOI20520.1 hypothetical protein [Vibrio coralliilyticus]